MNTLGESLRHIAYSLQRTGNQRCEEEAMEIHRRLDDVTTAISAGSPQWHYINSMVHSTGSVPNGYELKSVKLTMHGYLATYHERGGVFNFGDDVQYEVNDGIVRRVDTGEVYEVSREDEE